MTDSAQSQSRNSDEPMTPEALVKRLRDLEQRSAEAPWFYGHGEGEGGLSVVDDGRTAHDSMHSFQCEAWDAELICVLRNNLDQICRALATVRSERPFICECGAKLASRSERNGG